MNYKIAEIGPKLTECEITLFETKYGLVLPAAYRKFLMEFNGGRPCPDGVPVVNHPEKVLPLQVLFGITRDINSSCVGWNIENAQAPSAYLLIPIGASDNGDIYHIGIGGDRAGHVFFSDLTGVYSEKKLYHVADDFESFLNSLIE